MLNMNKYKSEMMYDRGAKNNMAVPESTSIIKVQGNAHFGSTYKYKLVGRLETGFKWIPIILVKDSNADIPWLLSHCLFSFAFLLCQSLHCSLSLSVSFSTCLCPSSPSRSLLLLSLTQSRSTF